jgi:hypothetical protein
MKTKYSLMCEAANVSSTGNLNAYGIFHNINVRHFPIIIPRMFYVACIQFHRSETGTHLFRVNFIDDDGRPLILPLEREIMAFENKLTANFLMGLDKIQFQKPGTYEVHLMINNQLLAVNTIRVVEAPLEQV